ncbi:TlpA family protein disulfide reductase [Salinimicrobium soli]|uniref:TlpA family protein disulfide reductase n=1 Tax=Salinimicrobium soli TaxID=1254399 RepID=UPI003AB088AF
MKIYLFFLIIICYSCKNNSDINKANEEVDISSLSKIERVDLVNTGKTIPNGKITTSDSSSVDIKSFEGKLLIIDFWATWCSPCLKEAPVFKRLATKYKSSDVEFISISIDQNFNEWKNFISEKNWTGKNYWFGMREEDAFFSLVYSKILINNKEEVLIGLPKYIFVSPQGLILNNSNLRPSRPEFEQEIIKYLN